MCDVSSKCAQHFELTSFDTLSTYDGWCVSINLEIPYLLDKKYTFWNSHSHPPTWKGHKKSSFSANSLHTYWSNSKLSIFTFYNLSFVSGSQEAKSLRSFHAIIFFTQADCIVFIHTSQLLQVAIHLFSFFTFYWFEEFEILEHVSKNTLFYTIIIS